MEINKYLLVAFSLALVLELGKSFHYEEIELEREEGILNMYDRWSSIQTVPRSPEDKEKRFNAFRNNALYVNQFNKGDMPYKLALNLFADMTNEEFTRACPSPQVKRGIASWKDSFMYENVVDVAPSIDWVDKGAVTPVRNQGSCCGCWAFSTVVGIEGLHQIRTGELVTLSVQQLLDCDNDQNKGCEGGWAGVAYEFVKKNGGIKTEEKYPYKGVVSACNDMKNDPVKATIDGFEKVPSDNETAMMHAVANQPISAAIHAGGYGLQLYSEGVYTGPCEKSLNHEVGVVGYGTDSSTGFKYWKIKNSWGDKWGDEGYLKMIRDIDDKEGICGISSDASYPVKIPPKNIKDEL